MGMGLARSEPFPQIAMFCFQNICDSWRSRFSQLSHERREWALVWGLLSIRTPRTMRSMGLSGWAQPQRLPSALPKVHIHHNTVAPIVYNVIAHDKAYSFGKSARGSALWLHARIALYKLMHGAFRLVSGPYLERLHPKTQLGYLNTMYLFHGLTQSGFYCLEVKLGLLSGQALVRGGVTAILEY